MQYKLHSMLCFTGVIIFDASISTFTSVNGVANIHVLRFLRFYAPVWVNAYLHLKFSFFSIFNSNFYILK